MPTTSKKIEVLRDIRNQILSKTIKITQPLLDAIKAAGVNLENYKGYTPTDNKETKGASSNISKTYKLNPDISKKVA